MSIKPAQGPRLGLQFPALFDGEPEHVRAARERAEIMRVERLRRAQFGEFGIYLLPRDGRLHFGFEKVTRQPNPPVIEEHWEPIRYITRTLCGKVWDRSVAEDERADRYVSQYALCHNPPCRTCWREDTPIPMLEVA